MRGDRRRDGVRRRRLARAAMMEGMHLRSCVVAAAFALTACSTAAQSARQPSPTDVVATVGSRAITLADVDAKALQQPASNFGASKLVQALYQARRSAIDDLVADALI